jgi:hypothetical protein
MNEELDKEMKETYGKFIEYTVDHIFDTNDSDVKKNARILYDNYDKAYREFRQSYIEKYGEDVVVRCAAIIHKHATGRLAEYK